MKRHKTIQIQNPGDKTLKFISEIQTRKQNQMNEICEKYRKLLQLK